MTQYLQIPKWSDFQDFKKVKKPAWIKVYKDLLLDRDFTNSLTDSQKAQLLCLWLVASTCGNRIPFDTNWLKKVTGLSRLCIESLLDTKWLQLADDEKTAPRLEKRREEKRRGRVSNGNVSAKTDTQPVKDLLENMPTLQALHGELRKHILEAHPRAKLPKPGTKDYINERATLSQLVRLDHFSEAEVVDVIRWVFTDGGTDATFWKQQVQSVTGLRKKCGDSGLNKFARLEEAMLRDGGQVEDLSISGGNPFADGKGVV